MLSLVQFRQFRESVRQLLSARGLHPASARDSAMIAAWLADRSPAQFVAEQLQRPRAAGKRN
jgi:hypothetical protein